MFKRGDRVRVQYPQAKFPELRDTKGTFITYFSIGQCLVEVDSREKGNRTVLHLSDVEKVDEQMKLPGLG